MMIKSIVKILVGTFRAKWFQIQAGKNVYIGKCCSLKGKQHIILENFVTIRPYAQLWSSGTVRVGEGSEIGERCRISISNSLIIFHRMCI